MLRYGMINGTMIGVARLYRIRAPAEYELKTPAG